MKIRINGLHEQDYPWYNHVIRNSLCTEWRFLGRKNVGMKIFHTADWHLGKLVQGVYMTDDQAYVLDQLVADIETEKPDVVVIAGDLYDRPIPPAEAVELLDKTLGQIVLGLGVPVIAIAGNHDSPSRLDFGSSVMRDAGLHIIGTFSAKLEPVRLSDEYGEVEFYPVPYVEPSYARYVLQEDDLRTHDDVMRAVVERIVGTEDAAKPLDARGMPVRRVFVGHAFVTPHGEAGEGNSTDAERPLSIGGADYVNSEYFRAFNYTALGHLHEAHFVGEETVRYAGSLLKYSISEARHKKGYTIVHMDAEGKVELEKRYFAPRRDIRMVEGLIDELERTVRSEDYVYVRLLDAHPVLFAMERVRKVFPNAMHVEQGFGRTAMGDDPANTDTTDTSGEITRTRAQMEPGMLFRSFYRDVIGQEADVEMEKLFLQVLQECEREEEK
jgi:exonuclease SbcD